MKILFAAPENAWGGFLGKIRSVLPRHEFVATDGFNIGSLEGFDVLIPTMSMVTAEVMDTGRSLKLIQQCGAGLETVDIKAAVERGIWVANVPTDKSGNADSVAELGIYMMIGLSRDVEGMSTSLKERRMGEPQGRALLGKTVGLVGLGGIGKALARRLKPFGVRLVGLRRNPDDKTKREMGLDWIGGKEDLESLLGESDYVLLCLPLTDESRDIINKKTIYWMKQGSFLINLSRGGLVNRDALEEALARGHLAGAGLDVFWEEPPDPCDPIFSYNVMVTPHIGGSTDVSIKGIIDVVAGNIQRVERGKRPLYVKSL
ncbi:MAG: 2-hydroxyacid dehydrogenase [Deltaproteobacteria bacterium]|nr:2-hydroxyacid dehydrogenase [Deltaproteobacteria bacterium]